MEISAKYWLSWSALTLLPPISVGLFLVLVLLLTCAHNSLAEPLATLVSLLLRIDTNNDVINFARNLISSLNIATSAQSISFIQKNLNYRGVTKSGSRGPTATVFLGTQTAMSEWITLRKLLYTVSMSSSSQNTLCQS